MIGNGFPIKERAEHTAPTPRNERTERKKRWTEVEKRKRKEGRRGKEVGSSLAGSAWAG